MGRKAAVELKRSLKFAEDEAEIQRATLALLRHSLRLGHGKLLFKRLEAAVNCRAELTSDDIDRCLKCLLRRQDLQINQGLLRLSQHLSQSSSVL